MLHATELYQYNKRINWMNQLKNWLNTQMERTCAFNSETLFTSVKDTINNISTLHLYTTLHSNCTYNLKG